MDKALVIGASGGIGAALAVVLEKRGVAVTRLSRSGHGLDLRDPEAIERVMSGLVGCFDTILIATGILTLRDGAPERALVALDVGVMAEIMQVNAIGPAMILRHAPRLLPRKGRSVLGVLSARVGSIGDNQLGGWHSYRASKAALNQIVRGAAIELSRSHKEAIVAALHPGTVATPFTAAYAPAYEKLPPEESARRLLDVLDSLSPAETGRFWDYKGQEVPW